MQWLEKITRPEIWGLKAYSSARSEFGDTSGMIQLDANENPHTPYPESPQVNGLNRYPDPQPQVLLSKLGAIYNVESNQVLVSRGMDEIIDLLVRVFCIPYQDNILITPPTFGYYEVAANISGIKVNQVTLDIEKEFNLDYDKLTQCVDKNTKIIFLCTPNNPTGSILSLDLIKKIANNYPHTIIAVDEAYIEFSDSPSASCLIKETPNVVVMKTLSKAYAFAGVRVGTLIAISDIINLVRKVLAPYPLPTTSVNLTLELLSPFGLELANSRIQIIKAERQRMFNYLSKVDGITVFPSHANFLLVKVDDASDVYNKLLSKGIIIRNRSKDIPNTLRISIGTPIQNNLVLKAFGVLDCDQNITSVRHKTLVRKTNETEVLVEVDLDQKGVILVNTTVPFLDHMLEQLAKHGKFSLKLNAKGDTHIDYHHLIEDVAITLGSALHQALNQKIGINRYGFVLPMDESCAFATIDLCGRSTLVFEADFKTPLIGNFPVEMVEHFFISLTNELKAAVHLKVTGSNAHHMVEALFKAFAKAFSLAIEKVDNDLPSTKGVI